MPNTKPHLFFHYRIAFGAVTALFLVFGLVLVGQGFINSKSYRDQFVRIIHEQTGREVTIKGAVSVSLLPTQTIFVSDVELRDPTSDTPAPAITVDMVRIDVTALSILSDHPHISAITLQNPVLEITRAHDNLIHWDWINPGLLKSLAGKQDSPIPLNVEDGKIIYYDSRNETTLTTDNIRLYTTIGKNFSLNGSLMFSGHSIQLSLDNKADKDSKTPPGATPVNVKVFTDPRNMLQLQGSVDFSANAPKIQGKLELEMADVMTWIGFGTVEEKKFDPFAIVRKTSEEKNDNTMPLKLTGDLSEDGLNVQMTNLQLQGMDSAGKGKISLSWIDWQPDITTDMTFSTLNYDQWKMVATNVFAKKSRSTDNPYAQRNKQSDNPLPKDFQATLAIAADQLTIGSQTWQKANISAQLSEGAITVNQFNIELPGEAKLGLFGVISQGSTGGLRFEGSMETAGKSLRQLLTIFNESASDLPETGFGDFYVHSNIFVSQEQMRLSEADVKMSDLKLGGGLVAYFDSANPRIEADVRLKDINFDYFRDTWRKKQQTAKNPQKFFLQFDKSTSYNWLKNLQTTIDLKVNVDGFTFLERKGDTASFRLYVRQNEFGIYDIIFNYPDESTSGGFKLAVKDEQPYVDVTLNTNQLDTKYFSPEGPTLAADDGKEDEGKQKGNGDKPTGVTAKEPAKTPDAQVHEDKKWSEELIDMGWMEGFNGAFNLSIGKLIHGDMVLTGIKMQAMLDHNLLTFQNFNFGFWQARCSLLGSVYGGKVPGLSISYSLYNAELGDTLKSLTKRDNLTGKVNINGTLTTSGVNALSWVEQSDAKILMNGNVHAQGVNIPGVVAAVQVSRTAADVFNNVNLALVNGATDFEVGGTINVKNGVMQTPGISLKTGTTVGNFRGEINLVPWTLNISTLFQFPSMPSDTVPTLTVQIVGPFDTPELRTDTSSLEAYVTGHIKGG